jgi:hypothetical protein
MAHAQMQCALEGPLLHGAAFSSTHSV